MAYEKQTWVDGTTPVDAEHLDHIEDGIAANADDIDSLSADLTDLMMIDTTVGESVTLESGKNGTFYVTGISRDGYSALGIVGFSLNNADDGGKNCNKVYNYRAFLDSNNTRARLALQNTADDDAVFYITVYVLYSKSSTTSITTNVGDPVVMGED